MNNTNVIHVYGVVEWPEGSGQRISEEVGIDGARVLAIPCQGVAALASLLPAGEFGEEALKHKLRNPEPAGLITVLCAHAGVLTTFVSEEGMDGSVRALVPLRFGAVFLAVESVVEWLTTSHDHLLFLLSRMRNKREWDIKLSADNRTLQERIKSRITAGEPNEVPLKGALLSGSVGPARQAVRGCSQTPPMGRPDVRWEQSFGSNDSIGAGGQGAQYLFARSHQMCVAREVSALAVGLAQELHTALREQAAEHCFLTFQSPPPDRTSASMNELLNDTDKKNDERSLIFHGVYLVERPLEYTFLRAVTSFQGNRSVWGITTKCSGPFPAYHFSMIN